jgi:hypothetical protein
VSRTLTANAVVSLNALETDNAFWILVTVDHPELGAPYRYVNNTQNVTSNGNEFVGYPFEITLAVDDGETLPSVEVKFDNVDRELMEVIRGLTSAPRITLQLVLSNAPDVVELSLEDLELMDINYDLQSISGRLVSSDLLNAPYPCDAYDPAQFAGLFY